MAHKKKEYVETLAKCWNFPAGNCTFGDEDCWFSHNICEKTDQNLKCNFCNKTFSGLPELLKHRKQEHRLAVPKCRNETCKYGIINCWFNHDNLDTNENDKFIKRKHRSRSKTI
jgi:hypothetical protein